MRENAKSKKILALIKQHGKVKSFICICEEKNQFVYHVETGDGKCADFVLHGERINEELEEMKK